MEVVRLNGNEYVGVDDTNLAYFEVSGRSNGVGNDTTSIDSFTDWGRNTVKVGGYRVIPFGDSNDIPNQIITTVYSNHLAPRIQNRKVELLTGQCPYLYVEEVTAEGDCKRKAVKDPILSKWLMDMDYEEDLHYSATQYYYTNVIFTKIYRDRAGYIGGRSSVAKIECLDTTKCRLAYREGSRNKKPTHVIIGDFKGGNQNEFEVYPLFNKDQPTKHPVAIHYIARKSFGIDNYSMPEIFGVLPWINRSTAIPKVIEALTDNSLNIKWHITSPKEYWDEKRKMLQKNLKDGEQYSEKMLDDLKEKIFKKLTDLLSGVENVGKYWHNETVVKIIGGNAVGLGWKITPIEQKVKDYVKSQLEIATKADFSVVAGLGLMLH